MQQSTESFNSRTPGGVRHHQQALNYQHGDVSIHAPREGCDEVGVVARPVEVVSIHAPREGCDILRTLSLPMAVFQFTHPGRGATVELGFTAVSTKCFNSRTPGGVRQCGAKLRIIGRINKRNLREGEWKGWEGIRVLL